MRATVGPTPLPPRLSPCEKAGAKHLEAPVFDLTLRKGAALFAAACSVAAVAGAAPAVAETSLTPEQVTDLYIGATINDDAAKVARLNAYLKPISADGKPVSELDAIRKVDATTGATIAGQLKQALPEQLKGKVEPVLDQFARSLSSAVLRSRCKADSSAVAPDDSAPGRVLATVQYSCAVPDAADGLAKAQTQVGETTMDKASPTLFTQVFGDSSKALDSAPLAKQIQGQLILSASADKTDWVAQHPESVFRTVMGAVMVETQTP
jgi:hypothetical protein